MRGERERERERKKKQKKKRERERERKTDRKTVREPSTASARHQWRVRGLPSTTSSMAYTGRVHPLDRWTGQSCQQAEDALSIEASQWRGISFGGQRSLGNGQIIQEKICFRIFT